jgi:hypothetical protein
MLIVSRNCEFGARFILLISSICCKLFSILGFPSQFDFRVTVSGTGNRTATSAPVRLTRKFVPAPIVSISLSVPTQGAAFTVITAADRVALRASVTPADPSAPSMPAYALQWTCTSGSVDVSAGSAALLSSPTSSALVLAANALTPGASYAFAVTLTTLEAPMLSSTATVAFTVANVPRGGQCTVSPSSGVALVDLFTVSCQGWMDDALNYPLAFQFNSVTLTSSSSVTLQDFSPATTLSSSYLSAGASLRVAVRNRWGGLVDLAVAVNVTNPPVATAAQLDSVAATALNVLARAQGSGDVNAASQAAAPLLQILAAIGGSASQSNASTAFRNETQTQQRADIRSQLFAASMAIIAQSSGAANSTTTGSSTGSASSSSSSMDAVAQSVALIASIVTVSADRATEVSGAVAAGGSAFAAQTAQSALASSAAPFTPALALGIVNIASASVMASAANATAAAVTAASGNSGVGGSSPSQQQQQQQQQRQQLLNAAQLQVTRAAAAATESVARGLLIGAVSGQAPSSVVSEAISLVATRSATLPAGATNATNVTFGSGNANTNVTGGSVSFAPARMMSEAVAAGQFANAPSAFDAALIEFATNVYAFADANGTRTDSDSTPVLSFSVFDAASARNAAPLPIGNLSTPLLISIRRGLLPPAANLTAANEAVVCRFWDVSAAAWSTQGCRLHAQTPTAVVCACTHLTAFGATKLFVPPLKSVTAGDAQVCVDARV